MPDQTTFNSSRRWAWIALIAAAVLRIAAAFGDLEIDEIWTVMVVQIDVKSFSQIFVLRHDNNHLLNTIILYLLGPGLPGICYRLPAVILSIATVWLAGIIARRRAGFVAELMTLILVGSSYLLVLYGTEARGYSYAVFLACASWLLLQRIDAERRWTDAVLFGVSASLGFLGHLTFLYCYAGFCVWTAWKWVRKPSAILFIAHLPPLILLGILYYFFIRLMIVGGGPPTTILAALTNSVSALAGGPLQGDFSPVAAWSAATLLFVALITVWKSDRAAAICYLTIVAVGPGAILALTGSPMIYPRYFLIPAIFALLMISEAAATWWRAGSTARMTMLVVCGAFVVGNLRWNLLLLDHGRGDYSNALKWMVEQSNSQGATVSSDHDFRNQILFRYYTGISGQTRLRYIDQKSMPPLGTDWKIRHQIEGDRPLPQVISDTNGVAYKLKRIFTHHGLAGWDWWIYQRIEKHQTTN